MAVRNARPARFSLNQIGRGSEPVIVVASGRSFVARYTLASPAHVQYIEGVVIQRTFATTAPELLMKCGRMLSKRKLSPSRKL